MKRKLKILTIAAFLVIAPLLIFAQPPSEPPHPGDPGQPGGGTPVGAPIGDGVFILLTLAVAYGGPCCSMCAGGCKRCFPCIVIHREFISGAVIIHVNGIGL